MCHVYLEIIYSVVVGYSILYYFLKDFLMGTIFKVFIEFVIILLLLFMFWFCGHEACGILALQPGIKPTPSALEGKALTTAKEVPLIIVA